MNNFGWSSQKKEKNQKNISWRPSKHNLTHIKVSLNKVLMDNYFIYSQLLSERCVIHLLRFHETKNALQLPVFFFFLFFFQPYWGLGNCKLVFQILKILQRGGLRRWVQFFARYPCKNWCKNWDPRCYKNSGHQIWEAGTSTGFDSNEINHARVGDMIMSRSRDKLKQLYLYYQSVYGQQTWQDGNLPCGLLPIKWHDPLITWSWEITWQTKIIFPLPECLWLPKLRGWYFTLMGSRP